MNKVKSALSVLMCLVMLAAIAGPAYAVSLADGDDALRAQWSRDAGPVAAGYSLDYSYFEPKGDDDKKPLFVFLPGAGECTYPGKELIQNDFCRWSSEEIQSKVTDADGAYLLILRAPEPLYFDTTPTEAMHAAITDFVSRHNVDERRVYVAGWCLGGTGAVRLVTAYPKYYAGLFGISMRATISSSEAKSLRGMAIWLMACSADTFCLYGANTAPSWSNVKSGVAPEMRRLTTSSSAPRAAAIFNHKMWPVAENEFAPEVAADYDDLETIDGSGNAVDNASFISWFSSFSRAEEEHSAERASGIWDKIRAFFKSIADFFRNLFSAFA